MSWKKHSILTALVALLFTAMPGIGQANSNMARANRANVLLRFMKDGTLSTGCSQTLGLITQSMLQVDGVKNVKLDAKNNGVQVVFDPDRTTPEKIAVTFNQENPDTPLRLSDTKPRK
jgi:hypothetical protein